MTHIIIDLPMGPTAKVRSREAAQRLGKRMVIVGTALGLNVRLTETDGIRIGPALEARDVLMVLQQQANAPVDLRVRAVQLAGELLEIAGRAPLVKAKSWQATFFLRVTLGGNSRRSATHREIIGGGQGGYKPGTSLTE